MRKKQSKTQELKNKYKVNNQITARQVRLVGDNVEEGIYSIEQARKLANENEVDMVEIFSRGKPPVVKLIDFGKFLYEMKKKEKEIKQKSAKTVLKEVRFGPNTDDHDFNFKLNHARGFLKDGAKVKAFVHFKGRTIVHKERGELLLLKFAEKLDDLGKMEQLPKMEGKRMFIFINPKVAKK